MRQINTIAIAVAAILVLGCGIEPETVATLGEAVSSVSANSSIHLDNPDANVPQIHFEPTHPDRVDPFTFPDNTPFSSEEVGTSITSAAQVDILGFADVGEAKVLIRAKELTRLLAVGDQHNGVEVIAIHPPAVKLRMGNLEWTATMFDKTSADRE